MDYCLLFTAGDRVTVRDMSVLYIRVSFYDINNDVYFLSLIDWLFTSQCDT